MINNRMELLNATYLASFRLNAPFAVGVRFRNRIPDPIGFTTWNRAI
jgi:hypothetical protein